LSTWLTQITPDFRNACARGDLRDAVKMHQRVMTLVPDGLGDQPRRQAGVLYRIEEIPHGARILVQAQVRPDLARLPADYGTVQFRDLDPLLRWLRPDALVRYRLTANTCLRKARSTKVVPLRGADADQWWITRAPAAGLDLQSLISRSPGDAVGGDDPKRAVRHALTQFDGVAAVTDPAALASAIIAGIGRGKSHGCGLLSIAPAGDSSA
jgi:CRISPR system Cascade subunit CasE